MDSIYPNVTFTNMKNMREATKMKETQDYEKMREKDTQKLFRKMLERIEKKMLGNKLNLDIQLVEYDPHQGEQFVITRYFPYADFDEVISNLKYRGFESYLDEKHAVGCNCKTIRPEAFPCAKWLSLIDF